MTVRDAAKELNVNEATIYEWMKKLRNDGQAALPGSGYQKPEDEETRKLRDRVNNLKLRSTF
jgi:transposase